MRSRFKAPTKLTRHIAKKLRELRTNIGYSFEALSDLSGLSKGYLCELEQAKHSPTADVLETLSIHLKAHPRVFFLEKKDGQETTGRLQ